MNPALLEEIAGRWAHYATAGLVSGLTAAALVFLAARLLRRRLRPEMQIVLWSVVLVSSALPFRLPIPLLAEARPPAPLAGAPVTDAAKSPALSPLNPQAPAAAAAQRITGKSWLFLAWCGITLTGLVRGVRMLRRTRAVVSRARPAHADELPADVAALSTAAGIRRPVPVRITREIRSPAVAGLTSPVLLLPEGLAGRLTPAQWRWTVAHELLHIRRGDLWMQLGQSLVRTLLFYHPAVWLASRRLDARREEICDAGAASLTNSNPQETAAGFVTLLEWAGPSRGEPLAVAGMSRSQRQASDRLALLLRGVRAEPRRLGLSALVAATALFLAPGLRVVRAADSGSSAGRIRDLESRVAELERALQQKSALDTLRDKAQAAARARAARDADTFSADERHEMEQLYQAAKKEPDYEKIAAAMQPLLDRYPGSNRAGCAALYTGRGLSGAPREAWLQYAANEGRDCYFLDGTSVGGLARILLAADRAAAGDTAGRDRLLTEVRTEFAGGIDFDGTPLTELADRITNPNQPLQPP